MGQLCGNTMHEAQHSSALHPVKFPEGFPTAFRCPVTSLVSLATLRGLLEAVLYALHKHLQCSNERNPIGTPATTACAVAFSMSVFFNLHRRLGLGTSQSENAWHELKIPKMTSRTKQRHHVNR